MQTEKFEIRAGFVHLTRHDTIEDAQASASAITHAHPARLFWIVELPGGGYDWIEEMRLPDGWTVVRVWKDRRWRAPRVKTPAIAASQPDLFANHNGDPDPFEGLDLDEVTHAAR